MMSLYCVCLCMAQHWDKLGGGSGSSDGATASSNPAPAAEGGGGKDISELIAAEVAGLKDKENQRFKLYDTRVKVWLEHAELREELSMCALRTGSERD